MTSSDRKFVLQPIRQKNLVLKRIFGFAGHIVAVVALTLLTQLGGVAWLLAIAIPSWRGGRRMVAFVGLYAVLSVGSIWIAPQFGRVALPCWQSGPLQMQSWFYCAANRNYVTPELNAVLNNTAAEVARDFPGTATLVLDGNFPFWDGFPLLPHLSHDDGKNADLAFFYKSQSGYAPSRTKSPIGYFAFEQGPTRCSDRWPSLRWNLRPLQGLWADLDIEAERTRLLIETLAKDPRVKRILLEPHLKSSLGVTSPKVRFQGCHAARHDDHIHIQL